MNFLTKIPMSIRKPIGVVAKSLDKNAPKILLFCGIVGIPATVVSAVRETPKAIKLIEEEKRKRFADDPYWDTKELSKVDIIKTTWKCYIPTTILGSVSIACIIASSSINAKRYAALGSLYSVAESSLKEYKDKVKETIGDKKEQAICDEVAKEKIKKNPLPKDQKLILEPGDCKCFDAYTGRYFASSRNKLEKAQNELNRSLISNMWVSLNEVYWAIGLPMVRFGEEVGWNLDNMVDFVFSSQLDDDGNPCLVLDYQVGPKHDYR